MWSTPRYGCTIFQRTPGFAAAGVWPTARPPSACRRARRSPPIYQKTVEGREQGREPPQNSEGAGSLKVRALSEGGHQVAGGGGSRLRPMFPSSC